MTNTTIETRDFPAAQVASDLREMWADYATQGLTVFPLKRGGKNPGTDFSIKWVEDWVKPGRPTFPALWDIFSTGTYGLWLATGQCSKRVVLDLDSPEAAEYWRERLGEAVFNRALKVTSRRGHHLHFRIRADDDRPWPGHSDEEIGFDFRGDGGGVVLPPSVHASGHVYEWLDGELQDAPECLRKENQPKKQKAADTKSGSGGTLVEDLMLDPVTGGRGNNWLTRVAGGMANVFHARSVYEAVLHNINQASAAPIDHHEFEKTIESIWSAQQEKNLMPHPSSPVKVARRIIDEMWTVNGHRTLHRWRGSWVKWTGAHWREIEHQSVSADIQNRLESAVYEEGRDEDGKPKLLGWDPNSAKISDVANMVKNINLMDKDIESGDWLDGRTAGRVVAFQNGLLDIKTRRMSPATPVYFNTTSLPYDYEETDEPPVEWLKFLDSVLPGDADAIRVIQEWFGYVISGRTDLQKLLLMVGQTRSGKGTIEKVLSALLGGKQNVAGMTMSAFTTNFGMSPMIGKTLAVVGDARTPKRDREMIVERFLAVTGEDPLTIDRKNRDPYDGKVGARLMLMSNETLSLPDPSGALPNRFICVTFTQSFLGREDLGLLDRLLTEIPAILRWSLDGLDRLTKQGRFTEPASSSDVRGEMNANASKVKEFAEDKCEFGADKQIPVQDLFDEYKAWCINRGFSAGSIETFGTQFSAAYRGKFTKSRPTVNGRRMQVYKGVTLA
ncbi:phage/plasmid primase, P4 family [Streptomyces sp. NPDC005355]|uniref:phage/plasmid primase, P4 family n=1 Tax=Streptomyces sp. NPDC005355 TaxID=3157038 RepID=UPI0033B0D16C